MNAPNVRHVAGSMIAAGAVTALTCFILLFLVVVIARLCRTYLPAPENPEATWAALASQSRLRKLE